MTKTATTKKAKAVSAPAHNPVNDVVPGSSTADFNNKVVVLKREALAPAYQDKDRRFHAIGGFGCNPALRGTAVVGMFLLDGERTRIERYDIEGIAVDQTIPSFLIKEGQ